MRLRPRLGRHRRLPTLNLDRSSVRTLDRGAGAESARNPPPPTTRGLLAGKAFDRLDRALRRILPFIALGPYAPRGGAQHEEPGGTTTSGDRGAYRHRAEAAPHAMVASAEGRSRLETGAFPVSLLQNRDRALFRATRASTYNPVREEQPFAVLAMQPSQRRKSGVASASRACQANAMKDLVAELVNKADLTEEQAHRVAAIVRGFLSARLPDAIRKPALGALSDDRRDAGVDALVGAIGKIF